MLTLKKHLFILVAILMAFGNMMAAENGGIKLAGTTWSGTSKNTMKLEDGSSMGFVVKMTIDFVNGKDADMTMDITTTLAGTEIDAKKDVKGKLSYTFDGQSKGSMVLKQFDLIEGAKAKRPFTFAYNSDGSITLDCFLFEGMGITTYRLTNTNAGKKAEKQETVKQTSKPAANDNDVSDSTVKVFEDEIFQIVEEMPSYPGGESQMMVFISKNLNYPKVARETGIQGRVFVSVVIEPDGTVTNAKVKQGIGGGCDEEAIRVVESMPKWNPGKQRGTYVRVAYLIPVNFKL